MLHTVPLFTVLIFITAGVAYFHMWLLKICVARAEAALAFTEVGVPVTLFWSAILAFAGSFMWEEGTREETVGLRIFSLIPLLFSILSSRRLASLPKGAHPANDARRRWLERRGMKPQNEGEVRDKPREKREEVEVKHIDIPNPENGWDDDTPQRVVVSDYETKQKVKRRIAWPARLAKFSEMNENRTWGYDKIFGDGDFIAAGQLFIPPGTRKPAKATKDNTYIFYVIEGAVCFKIHDSSLVLATGGMFIVPRSNIYLIENIAARPAKLFFAQARRLYDEPHYGSESPATEVLLAEEYYEPSVTASAADEVVPTPAA